MKKKIKLSSQEKGLRELFIKLGYSSRVSNEDIKAFCTKNSTLINKVETFKKGYPSQKAILFAYYKLHFINKPNTFYDFKITGPFNSNDFIKNANRTCRRISKIFRFEKYAPKFWWNIDNCLLGVVYVLRKGSKVGNHNIIRPDNRSINYLAAIYLDKNTQKIYFHNIPPKILTYFNLILQDETKVSFVPSLSYKEVSWSSFPQKLLSNENLELVEIGLSKTDFATGDQIIIKPKDTDARSYLKALLDQRKIINADTFNISYIDYMKIRRKGGKYVYIKLKYANDGVIPEILNAEKDKTLLKELEAIDFPTGSKLVDKNKISRNTIVQQLLMSNCISKDELKNNSYSDAIKYLNDNQLIKERIDRALYFCWKCKGPFFLSKICPECGNEKPIWIPNGERFVFDIQKIKDDIKKSLIDNKVKYRRLRKPFFNNRFELQKASIEGLSEINIYLNLDGLYEPVLKNFRLCPLPLFVVNFRGEMKNELTYIHQINAADFLEKLYDGSGVIDLIRNTAKDSRLAEKKEAAFIDSIKGLKEVKKDNSLISSKKGNEFEWLSFNILSRFFPISSKWGGPSLPDGIIGFNKDNKKFAFWDAKRYDSTKLSSYANKRKGGIAKDLRYVIKSLTEEDTYEDGKLAYYLFVTSNTSKDDFLKILAIIDQKIEKEKDRSVLFKRLKSIKFCCINLPELIKFASLIEDKKNYENLQANSKDFEVAFEQLLNANDGYVSEEEINKHILPLTTRSDFIPDKNKHRA